MSKAKGRLGEDKVPAVTSGNGAIPEIDDALARRQKV